MPWRRFMIRFGPRLRILWEPASLGASFLERIKVVYRLIAHKLPFLSKRSEPFVYTIRFRGTKLRITFPSISELYLLRGIFLKRIYTVPLPQGDVKRIVDLGANIGLASLFFACEYPEARIEAYELDPDTIPTLQKNLSPFSRASVIGKAVSPLGGRQTLYRGLASYSSSILARGNGGVQDSGLEVESASIDDIVGDGIDVLKIDISGSEMPVLSACTKLGKIRAITGHFAVSYSDHTQQDIYDLLAPTHDVLVCEKAKGKTSTLVLAVRRGEPHVPLAAEPAAATV